MEKLRAVTQEDLLRMARRVLRPEKAALAVVAPDVHEEALAGLLPG